MHVFLSCASPVTFCSRVLMCCSSCMQPPSRNFVFSVLQASSCGMATVWMLDIVNCHSDHIQEAGSGNAMHQCRPCKLASLHPPVIGHVSTNRTPCTLYRA